MGGPTYTFHRCLGRGGFGEVYLATRHGAEGLEKRVAVKVLRPDLPNAESALKRLRDEGRMLAALEHPAIVGVLELTRLRGRIALVTEYVEGTDLSRFCNAPHLLPPKVVVAALGVVAGALDSAWTTPSPETGKPLNLVHRDIKPENIRLSRHGEVKLLDFGIARSTELAREARTATGNLPFTPGYTAPEAFVAMKQGAPTDVFALGATMFRLLVGERFYEGVRLTEQAALSSAPDKYRRFLADRLEQVPAVGGEIRPLLAEVLAYAPEDRPRADVLERRCEALAEELPGPTPRRWVRESTFPEERDVEGASLTGLTLTEDRPEDSEMFVRTQRVVPTAPPSGPPPPRPLVPASMGSMPPPVPAGLVQVLPSFSEVTIERPTGPGRAREPEPPPRGVPWMMLGVVFVLALALGAAIAFALVAGGVWMAW